MLVSIEQARNHLNSHGVDDDADLQLKINSAGLWVQEYLSRNVYPTQADLDAAVAAGSEGDAPMVVNDLIRSAILLTVGRMCLDREDMEDIPKTARYLLAPYRKGMGV